MKYFWASCLLNNQWSSQNDNFRLYKHNCVQFNIFALFSLTFDVKLTDTDTQTIAKRMTNFQLVFNHKKNNEVNIMRWDHTFSIEHRNVPTTTATTTMNRVSSKGGINNI